jgi:hypothetical protein
VWGGIVSGIVSGIGHLCLNLEVRCSAVYAQTIPIRWGPAKYRGPSLSILDETRLPAEARFTHTVRHRLSFPRGVLFAAS